ncbi:hypothetical protein ABTN24_19660, partial [Acinetobacter baumannii]
IAFPFTNISGTSYSFALTAVSVVPADVVAVSALPTKLDPFQTGVGTVILNGAAGPLGRTVTLTSNDPVISVPPTVTVTKGQRRAYFT